MRDAIDVLRDLIESDKEYTDLINQANTVGLGHIFDESYFNATVLDSFHGKLNYFKYNFPFARSFFTAYKCMLAWFILVGKAMQSLKGTRTSHKGYYIEFINSIETSHMLNSETHTLDLQLTAPILIQELKPGATELKESNHKLYLVLKDIAVEYNAPADKYVAHLLNSTMVIGLDGVMSYKKFRVSQFSKTTLLDEISSLARMIGVD